jgi:hypothetical protein
VEDTAVDSRPRAALPHTRGLAVVMFVIVTSHAVDYLWAGTPGILLWVCFAANVCVAFGLWLPNRFALGVGFLWTWIGLPLWLGESLSLSDWRPVSIALHLGGPICGTLGVLRLGLDRHAWLGGTALLLGCQSGARLLTDPALNVNAVFHVRAEAAAICSSLRAYWIGCTLLSVLVLFAMNWTIGYLLARRKGIEETRCT